MSGPYGWQQQPQQHPPHQGAGDASIYHNAPPVSGIPAPPPVGGVGPLPQGGFPGQGGQGVGYHGVPQQQQHQQPYTPLPYVPPGSSVGYQLPVSASPSGVGGYAPALRHASGPGQGEAGAPYIAPVPRAPFPHPKGGKGKRGQGRGKKGSPPQDIKGRNPKGKQAQQDSASSRHGQCHHGPQRWGVLATLERVPCVVTRRHIPDSRVVISSDASLPLVIVLKPGSQSVNGTALPSRLYIRPEPSASAEALELPRQSLAVGDMVLCNIEVLSSGRHRPDITSVVYPDASCAVMTSEVRAVLGKVLAESYSDRPLAEEVAEREIEDLSDVSVDVMQKRIRVIESRGSHRRDQMMNVCNLYGQVAKAVGVWGSSHPGYGIPLPDSFRLLLMKSLLQLPTKWGSHVLEASANVYSETYRVHESVAAMRRVLDAVLTPKDLAELHTNFRWLSYGSGDHLSEEVKQDVRSELHAMHGDAEEGEVGGDADMGEGGGPFRHHQVRQQQQQHQQQRHQQRQPHRQEYRMHPYATAVQPPPPPPPPPPAQLPPSHYVQYPPNPNDAQMFLQMQQQQQPPLHQPHRGGAGVAPVGPPALPAPHSQYPQQQHGGAHYGPPRYHGS